MKRLTFNLSLCLVCIVYVSCQNAYTNKKSPQDINRISSDELIYEIKNQEASATVTLPKINSTKKKKAAKLNNSNHQEMLVIYSHLEMSENQILLFENQFKNVINNPNPYKRTQMEIQEIMDVSFETVLSEQQFNRYKEWRVEDPNN